MTIALVTHPAYSYPFRRSHRFPMEKFGLLTQYLSEKGIAGRHNLFRPGRAREDILRAAHCPDYLQRFIDNRQTPAEIRRMGLPWSEGLRTRTLISPNGTLLAANLALQQGVACHLAGGTHHAHYNFASGFCILNDLAVAAKALLAQGKVKSILIFDCDVHQGDGTAAILTDEPGAFTCSIHCEKNFPARKTQSDVDIGLAPNTGDKTYLDTIDRTLRELLTRLQPDLVLYDAGVDVYEKDPLGLLTLSEDGIRQRERLVLEQCRHRGIAVATVIGGGYDDDRKALARRHAIVVEEAAAVYRD